MDLPDSIRVSRVPTYSTLEMIKFVTFGVPGYHRLWPDFPDCSAHITNFLLYENGGSTLLLMQVAGRNRPPTKGYF